MTGSPVARRKAAAAYVRLALVVGLVAPVLVGIGAFATKTGLLTPEVGYERLVLGWAALAARIGAAAGLLAVAASLTDLRRLLPWALAALVIPGATLAGFLVFERAQADRPPVHDVSTNWDEPPNFSDQMMARRGPSAAPVEASPTVPADLGPPWGGQTVAAINARTCPGAAPVPRQVSPDEAARALEQTGVQVIGRAPWRVEGTHESWWFGFETDVVVRIRPGRTDVRAVGRAARPDLGAACRRVTAIVEALRD